MSSDLQPEEIQQLLQENAHLIKVILKCQNEGRIMDAMLYQTRLQINLTQLASLADNRPHPAFGTQRSVQNMPMNAPIENSSFQAQLLRFTRAVKEMGLKNLNSISRETDIPLDKVGALAKQYIAFLKRQDRFTEATQLESELSMNGDI